MGDDQHLNIEKNIFWVYVEVNQIFKILHLSGKYHHCRPFLSGIDRQEIKTDGVTTRADSTGKPIKMGKSAVTQRSSVSDGIHIWNNSPKNVTESKSISQAKKEIRAFAKLLPV